MKKFLLFNLIGEINQKMEEKFCIFFEKVMNNPDLPVLINISSPGGNYTSAISIYNMLSLISDRVHCSITGICSGVAALIFSVVPFEKRFAFHYASMTISAISDELYISKNKELREIFSSSFDLDNDILNDIFENKNDLIITGNKFIQFDIAGFVNHIDNIIR